MLRLIVKGAEFFDQVEEKFLYSDDLIVELEHSLVSVSKWESKFEKPFLVPGDKTQEELFGYINAMVVGEELTPEQFEQLKDEHFDEIQRYIDSAQTATTFGDLPGSKGKTRKEVITSEVIYDWMISYDVPFECEKWHLNRLFALLRVRNIKTGKPQKLSRSELMARNRAMNEERKARLKTRG